MKLREICNYFIHSMVFSPDLVISPDKDISPDEDVEVNLQGVFINSDRIKEKELYYIELNVFIKLIEDTINDDIVRSSMIRHFDGRKPSVKKSRNHISKKIPKNL